MNDNKTSAEGHSQTLTQSDLVFINPGIYIYIYIYTLDCRNVVVYIYINIQIPNEIQKYLMRCTSQTIEKASRFHKA